MRPHWRTAFAIGLCALACTQPGLAQATPPTILTIDLDNFVIYQADIPDATKFGTNPNVTPSAILGINDFFVETLLADIVAVNGQPAKGLYAARGQTIKTSPAPAPGSAIADTTHNSIRQQVFEILKNDGTPVGTIIALGLSAGPAPPGAPAQTTGNWAIVGGTGAFLGARGQVGNGGNAVALRSASMAEDPSNRRVDGGGKSRWVLTVIPMYVPQVVTTANGPAVTHSSDFSLVSASKPASSGEILSLFANGLGPTFPGVDPGQPFPSVPLAVANSPVQVTVNGNSTQVLAAVGFPGAVDAYQVNFQVPPGTAKGPATVQVSAAWITGPAVTIQVQ